MKFKKSSTPIISIFALSLIASNASANLYTPPSICGFEQTTTGLSVEAPQYIAIGMPTRIKGDYSYDPFDSDKSVSFYNSHVNYVGGDETDSWDNAYIDMTFPAGSRGVKTIWAIDETDPTFLFCTKTQANVQSMPVIGNTSALGGQTISVNVNISIDSLSKRSVQGNNLPELTFKFINTDYNRVETFKTTSQNVNYIPQYTGAHTIEVTAFDGTFSVKRTIGDVFFTGGTPPDDGFGNDVPIR